MEGWTRNVMLQGRTFLTHEDIQVLLAVLGHRFDLCPESEMDGKSVEDIVQQLIQAVPVLKDAT